MSEGLKSLAMRLRESADEVMSFPHPSYCDHLHDASAVMREAADLIDCAPPIGPTGREPELLQDACSGLSKALSNKPDARLHAREAAAQISAAKDAA